MLLVRLFRGENATGFVAGIPIRRDPKEKGHEPTGELYAHPTPTPSIQCPTSASTLDERPHRSCVVPAVQTPATIL
eukprot:7627469-Heterocapsa_arctica.AAC.1